MTKSFLTSVAALTVAAPALAQAPSVAVDIAPVHSLVAQVMQGVGEPSLIVEPGANPHGYSMRPSQARALQKSDLVFWIGPRMSPWLEKPVDTLAADAKAVELLEVPGLQLLEFREEFHGDHDDHDDHAGHDDHHDHDHSGTDPHAWLSPANAQLWLGVIAEELAAIDPAHADQYRANAKAGQARIAEVSATLQQQLQPMQGVPFVAFHDAYQYFETSFGLSLAGTVSLGDASDPSPAQLSTLRETLIDMQITCAFSEPQYNSKLLQSAADGIDLQIHELDPLGFHQELGPDLYPQTLLALGNNMLKCVE